MDSTQHEIVWKQIAEAPTGYMVSNTGEIKVVYADGQFEMLRKQHIRFPVLEFAVQ